MNKELTGVVPAAIMFVVLFGALVAWLCNELA